MCACAYVPLNEHNKATWILITTLSKESVGLTLELGILYGLAFSSSEEVSHFLSCTHSRSSAHSNPESV